MLAYTLIILVQFQYQVAVDHPSCRHTLCRYVIDLAAAFAQQMAMRRCVLVHADLLIVDTQHLNEPQLFQFFYGVIDGRLRDTGQFRLNIGKDGFYYGVRVVLHQVLQYCYSGLCDADPFFR